MINIYEAQTANKRKSAVIVLFFLIFVAIAVYFISQAFSIYLGYQPGGLGIVGIAFIISGLMSFGSYFYSDKIVLSISRAHPASRQKDRIFYTVAENLSIAAGLPKPKLYVIEDTALNAFATGRNPKNAVVVATTGLLKTLNRTELEGVVAHELSHIKNYDVRLGAIVAVMVGMIALLGDFFLRMSFYGSRGGSRKSKDSGGIGALVVILGILFAVLSPIIAKLIQLAISRRREYSADAGAIAITRQPSGLISALKKISGDTEALEAANKATAHMYIVNPFKGKRDQRPMAKMAGIFNTHPSTSSRIATLQKMS